MIYIVKEGDTITHIANEFQVSADAIIYDNQIPFPYRLAIGQALFIADANVKARSYVSVNGYAYPFISEWVLEQTLPYLTELSIFSYGFTEEGDLLPPILEDQWMITEAYRYNVKPILTLTPFGADGMFNNQLIHAVVNNEAAKDRLILQLQETLYGKGFAGVDIDFEYILREDRGAFTAFVELISEILGAEGYQVSVALAPKTSTEQAGLLYEGKDYQAIGEAVDYVLLMTYEWGYTYGPPMAVAPINKVREVVNYAVTEIPTEKINLGIPNYGYDWELPFVSGRSRARTIGNVEAVQLAINYGVPIQYDEMAQSPYFHYINSEGHQHEVWFEDARSIQAKFNLIKEYGIRGIGYWQIMQLFRANWLLLERMFVLEKK